MEPAGMLANNPGNGKYDFCLNGGKVYFFG